MTVMGPNVLPVPVVVRPWEPAPTPMVLATPRDAPTTPFPTVAGMGAVVAPSGGGLPTTVTAKAIVPFIRPLEGLFPDAVVVQEGGGAPVDVGEPALAPPRGATRTPLGVPATGSPETVTPWIPTTVAASGRVVARVAVVLAPVAAAVATLATVERPAVAPEGVAGLPATIQASPVVAKVVRVHIGRVATRMAARLVLALAEPDGVPGALLVPLVPGVGPPAGRVLVAAGETPTRAPGRPHGPVLVVAVVPLGPRVGRTRLAAIVAGAVVGLAAATGRRPGPSRLGLALAVTTGTTPPGRPNAPVPTATPRPSTPTRRAARPVATSSVHCYIVSHACRDPTGAGKR